MLNVCLLLLFLLKNLEGVQLRNVCTHGEMLVMNFASFELGCI